MWYGVVHEMRMQKESVGAALQMKIESPTVERE